MHLLHAYLPRRAILHLLLQCLLAAARIGLVMVLAGVHGGERGRLEYW